VVHLVCQVSSRVAMGGLSPHKQSTKLPKLKYETLEISGVFIEFSMSSPLAQWQSPNYWT